ncbi:MULTISPECIES: hypothetical protein [Actinoplanes]|uniref:Uncharacterized protein n=2 Tax=Actinoplanes TaxID=1865 RepID=A0A101JDV5_9ACTN|nr:MULTISPECIES: hypothetical protein [Actinoplanes]KUL25003.1 hypothetical protein ADL15_42835 [Actinoplanes awajinensis subsp. mycoplanecinus]GIE64857.1 hypothetical protein Apa02nite_009650 [Actinoplanes palleronii]
MPWSWRYEDVDGKSVDLPTETFSSQADAESWIGQEWRQLQSNGVSTVILVEDDRVDYQMSLQSAE